MRLPEKLVKPFKKLQSFSETIIHQKESLRHQTAISVALRIANRLIAFALTWSLAAVLNPNELGDYSYAFSLISVLGIFARFGLPNFVIREVSQEKVSLNWGRVKGIVIWAVSFSLGASLLIIVVNTIALSWLPSYPEELLNLTIYWGLALLPFISLIPILGGILRAFERMIEGLLLNELMRNSIFTGILLLIGVVYSKGLIKDIGSPEAMAAHVGAAIATCIIGVIFLQKNWPQAAKNQPPVYSINTWRKPLLNFAALGGMGILNRNIDILMLGALTSSLEVGLYKITVPFSALVVMGLLAVRLVIAPRISKYYASQDLVKLKRTAQMATKALIVLAMPISIVIIIGGRYLLNIFFGEEYLAAYVPLVILVFGRLTSSIFGPVQTLLNMTGHEKDTATVIFISLIIHFVLNLWLIPKWGIVGTAIAAAFSTMVLNGALWIRVKQRLGFFLLPINT